MFWKKNDEHEKALMKIISDQQDQISELINILTDTINHQKKVESLYVDLAEELCLHTGNCSEYVQSIINKIRDNLND